MKNHQNLAVWNVKEEDFPKNGNIQNKLKFLIKYAILAPSGYNSQPWRFKISGERIEAWADLERGRRSSDPKCRELFMSMGCAITNLEIAAKHFEMNYKTLFFPHNESENLTTLLMFDGKKREHDGDNGLFFAIKKRQTNREKYEEKMIPKESLNEIQKTIKMPKIKLDMVSKPGLKSRVADLVENSIKIWYRDIELVKELKSWFGFGLKGANMKAEKEKRFAKEAAVITVLSSGKDDRLSWIKTGMAYELLALKTTSMGIQNAFFNAVIQLPGQRRKLQSLLGIKGWPQLIFRLGYGQNGKHTPRRPIEEVVEIL